MDKKRCLFCDELATVETKGAYERYQGCNCAPYPHYYHLHAESVETLSRLSYQEKRRLFPLVSGYIRELTDCEESVSLNHDEVQAIANSPRIPVTTEEKGGRLLQYLYRHAGGPDVPVVIGKLSASYNLTYANNLQEMVYLIERLREAGSLIREGHSLGLTEQGWREAAELSGGRKLKPCSVLLPNDEALHGEWEQHILPKLEQCGYLPDLFNGRTPDKTDHSIARLADSKLVIADISLAAVEIYYAGGYAAGLDIPVVWTIHRSVLEEMPLHSRAIRPLIWDTTEELGVMLQQRLAAAGA
ncbi:hypothetical protein PA598K_02550 [Paenibacillus sp. 598K]|uniref:hypothetical protein n=1 Tax=Paenibacillus sp. 598K TaxID=1117987 RepID=UPI000FFA8A74|nr:hypothetical protein [Paenibacillus sp. 598K]GBF74218.1 hypothetical protein PA598K_02550 [Paenibacillus sp. 598K]